MDRWEYDYHWWIRTFTIHVLKENSWGNPDDQMRSAWDSYGEKGWELVNLAVCQLGAGGSPSDILYVATFKRRL